MDKEIAELYPHAHLIKSTGTKNNHVAHLRLKCTTKEEFKLWLLDYQELSGVTFRVQYTIPRIGHRVLYKAAYRCQHNTYPKSHRRVKKPSAKHTDCQARLKVTVQSIHADPLNPSSDYLKSAYPTLVEVQHKHNHKIETAEARRYRDVSESCKQKFLELFKSNNGPAKALELHKQDLLTEYQNDFFIAIADRSICPDSQWVYRFYHSVYKKKIENKKVKVEDHYDSVFNNELLNSAVEVEQEDIDNVRIIDEFSTGSSPTSYTLQTVTAEQLLLIDNLTDTLKVRLVDGLKQKPREFAEATARMTAQLNALNTQSMLLSAMHCFGNADRAPRKRFNIINDTNGQ